MGALRYKNPTPCSDTVQRIRAASRDITIRSSENQIQKYSLGETVDHVGTLLTHLQGFKNKLPDTFEDPSRIRSLDETAMKATYGKLAPVFTSARSNLGGRRHNFKDSGIHVTAVIAAFASGLFALLFFVGTGKK